MLVLLLPLPHAVPCLQKIEDTRKYCKGHAIYLIDPQYVAPEENDIPVSSHFGDWDMAGINPSRSSTAAPITITPTPSSPPPRLQKHQNQ